jgi:A/G-specific adenine glycosylase
MIGWYQRNHRKLSWRKTSNSYFIWVSEVMLQQTQVKTVLNYYPSFIKKFPTIRQLASASLEEVLKSWELLGYYARARNLHRAAKIIIDQYDGTIPSNYKKFRGLPGVGDYISAAVTSIAFNQPYAALDGNVKRVLARLLLTDLPVNKQTSNKTYQSQANRLLDPANPGIFNQAMMELGATVCKPAVPLCADCPVTIFCKAFQQNKQTSYPRKIKKSKIPEYRIAIGVIKKSDKFLIAKRPPEGMLGGLWEFPGGKIKEGELPADACVREVKEELNLSVKVEKYLVQVKHAYTHFKVVIEVFICNHPRGEIILNGLTDYRWVNFSELVNYPIPSANHKIIKYLG